MIKQSDPRHEARKLAMANVFCWLFSDVEDSECFDAGKELLEINDLDKVLADNLVAGIKQHNDEIDKIIEECAPDWPLDKISKIDLVILRLAVFEVLFYKETPTKVAIDEAVELAKEFGNETSGKFVNGVLGSVVSKRDAKNEVENESI